MIDACGDSAWLEQLHSRGYCSAGPSGSCTSLHRSSIQRTAQPVVARSTRSCVLLSTMNEQLQSVISRFACDVVESEEETIYKCQPSKTLLDCPMIVESLIFYCCSFFLSFFLPPGHAKRRPDKNVG